MRRLILLCLGFVLAVPATALAVQPFASGDGTLAIRSGDGSVRFDLRSGVVLGRFASGSLEIMNPEIACDDLLVWDYDQVIPTKRDSCLFRAAPGRDGEPLRFRLVSTDEDIRIAGRGIFLSAVGRGRVYLEGSQKRARDGQYSLNGGPFKSLPDDGQFFAIAAP
jgi:hypothetical protein